MALKGNFRFPYCVWITSFTITSGDWRIFYSRNTTLFIRRSHLVFPLDSRVPLFTDPSIGYYTQVAQQIPSFLWVSPIRSVRTGHTHCSPSSQSSASLRKNKTKIVRGLGLLPIKSSYPHNEQTVDIRRYFVRTDFVLQYVKHRTLDSVSRKVFNLLHQIK